MSPHPLSYLAHRPLAILPASIDSFAMRFAEPAALAPTPEASRFVGQRMAGQPYRVDGVTAIIGILNPLTGREGQGWGTTSYEYLGAALEAAARDTKVRSILLDLDSPGGHAQGMAELAATIRRINASKPVVAAVNGLCASACYCIASAAKTIITTPSSTLGSIGIVLVHGDFSRAFDAAGISPSLIHAGKKKVLGNMYRPLSKDDRSDLQREVDAFFDMFVTAVAAERGSRLAEQKARATEGATYLGKDAIAAGLADALGGFDDALVAARRAGDGAKAHVVKLPAAAALPKPAPKADADPFDAWKSTVDKLNARLARERGI